MTDSKWNLNSIVGLPIVVVVVTLSTGCTPWQMAKRTLFSELNEYPRNTEGRLACKQYTKWARKEWGIYAAGSPNTHSSDYIGGFIQGFTKYVHSGGNTDPPAVPPRRYWRVGYKNERGRAAIQQWYNGYAHGTQVAKDKGYRERATLPSSLLLGYNAEIEAAWERNPGSNQHADPELGGQLTELNEPTLAAPTDEVPNVVEPLPDGGQADGVEQSPGAADQGDPFKDDDEQLPDAQPIEESANGAATGSGLGDGSVPPADPEPEFDESNQPGVNESEDPYDVFGDDLSDSSVFKNVVPRNGYQASFEVEQTPPPPPWLAAANERSPDTLFSANNTVDPVTLPEPTASHAAYLEIVAESPSEPPKFDNQKAFEASLPDELRVSDDATYTLHDTGIETQNPAQMDVNPIGSGTVSPDAKGSQPNGWKPR